MGVKIIENKAKVRIEDKIGKCECPQCKSILYVGNADIIEDVPIHGIGPVRFGGKRPMAPGYVTFYCPCCNQIVKIYQ